MQHSGSFKHRDISTTFNIPISLWVQNGTHLLHKNSQTLVDKTGKRLCIKCIVEMFSNNEKSSTYLSKICEDLMLVIKCERGRGIVRFIINELLSNEGGFVFEEINKVDDEMLLNNLINLVLTLLNKHFSISENMQRQKMNEHVLSVLIKSINDSNTRMKSMAKLIYVLFDDRLSIYSNSFVDGVVESSENLSRFGTIISRAEMENIQYVIPVVIKIMECKPEKVILSLLDGKGLHLSRLLCESSEKKTDFEYMLELYIHVLNEYPSQFKYLLVEKTQVSSLEFNAKEELSLNILRGIEKMTMFLAKSSKYSKSKKYHQSRNLNLHKMKDSEPSISHLDCMKDTGSIPSAVNFPSNENLVKEMDEFGERSAWASLSSKSKSGARLGYGGAEQTEIGDLDEDGSMLAFLRRREKEDGDNSLMKNLLIFLKGFMLHRDMIMAHRRLSDGGWDFKMRNQKQCHRSEWLMEGESFEIAHKIIEWVIELLRNSIEIDLDILALDCILQIFTREECCHNEENHSDLNSNSIKDTNCELQEEDLNESPDKDLFCEHKPKKPIIFNIKPLNPKAKRVTFKRNDETPHKKKLISNSNVDTNKLRVNNACMQGGVKVADSAGIERDESCGELCFHRIFVEKHGQYLMDIFLELFDDYLRKFGLNYLRKRSRGSRDMSHYDQGYKYIVDNERQIEEVLQKIIKGMCNISGAVAIQSCPRQIYALSWFMDFVLNGFLSEESVLRSKPLVPLYGSSSMDVVMNAVDVEQPLEHALLSISAKISEDRSPDVVWWNPSVQRGGFVNLVDDYLGQQLLQLANQIISLIEGICRCLCVKGGDRSELEEENASGGEFYRVDIKKLWKMNGTIYSRDLLLKYFSSILQITQKLCGFKGIQIVKFLESTYKLFEFYSKALKEKEHNMISLSQLYLIQQIFESRQTGESEVKEAGAEHQGSDAAFMYDLFSIVLQIDKRVRDNIEESEETKDHILQRASSKIKLLINNKAGAQLILEWMKSPNIGNQEIFGIKTSVLKRWIVHISRQLLDPIMTESEISSRLKYLNKERIRAALLLDESASNDTISIVISLLTFSHRYFPDQVTQFILRNINKEEVNGTDYYLDMCDTSEDTKLMQKIQNYGKSSVFGDFNARNVPARVLFYYSSILLGNRDCKNGENVHMFRDETGQKCRILSKIISVLVSSNTRRREWLLWHSRDFEKSGTFSDSLQSLIGARGMIGSYQEQKRVEEQVFTWICDRNMDYARYQVVARPFSASCFYPGLVEFSVSPILERSILENMSFIKFEIKQLLSLSSMRVGGASNNEAEVEEFAQSLNMYLNLFIFSIRSYIGRDRRHSFDDQLTVEEVTLPLKLFLNINKEDCDFRLKALISHLTLKFISAFLVPKCREITTSQDQSCNSTESLSRVFSVEKPLRALERFGKSSSRRGTNILIVLVGLVDELTRWVNDTFNTNNVYKFDISTYLETLLSLILELGLKGGGFSECMDMGVASFEESEVLRLKARQSLIGLIQGDSTRLVLEKAFHYIVCCRKRGNHLDASRPSQLMVVLAMFISMFLSKFQIVSSDDRLERLVDLVLAHPTLLFHADPTSRCGVMSGLVDDERDSHWLACLASSGKGIAPCEGCFRFGLDNNTEEVKLVAIASFIVAMLCPGQSRAVARSSSLVRELFLQSITGILSTSRKGSSVNYGYLGIILAIIYLNGDQILSISLVHNLHIQKFLVKEFISEILDFDKGSSLSPCVAFHYSALLSYLVFVLKVTPWWLNISDFVNLAFINKLGKIYKSLQGSVILHDEDDTISEYLLGLTEILLKITLETARSLLSLSGARVQDDDGSSVASLGIIVKLIQDLLKNQTNENIQDYNITLVTEHSNLGSGSNGLKCVSEGVNDEKSGCLICCQWYRRRPSETDEKFIIKNFFIGQVLRFSAMEIFKRIIGN